MPPPVPRTIRPRFDLFSEAQLEHALYFDAAIDNSARLFIESESQLETLVEDLVADPVRFIKNASDVFSKLTRQQHLKAAGFVYALWVRSGKSGSYQNYINRLRSEQKRQNNRTTNLHLIARHIIRYGEESDGKSLSEHRGLHNRDVSAILYLHSQGIGPNEVEDLGANEGEGLDSWSRKWTAIKRRTKGISASNPASVSRDIVVSVQSFDLSGKVLRERLTITDNEHNRALLDKLRKQRIDLIQEADRPDNAVVASKTTIRKVAI